ncbi:hypothetical protein HN832_01625 [archaeon]|jgi:predicted DNA binding protein|nr:hypothetical protein [archaeon]MBT4373055.1 hypothetical protein [archaeon]MBT4531400.1 hypothetical protein [archaeon]MBT7001422.1 hypothetical protein [archaeon]MBT7282092.1 hypothetical protein [archaeon]
MWVLKLKVPAKKQVLGPLVVKHKISIASYILSYYKDQKNIFLIGAGFMFGEKKNKKSFIRDIKKQPWLVNYENRGDFGIIVIKEPLFTEAFWNPKIIQINPIIINHNSKMHVWSFASFDRKLLEKAFEFAEKYLDAKMVKFKEEKISNISFTKLLPEITKNQKEALELAINNGYYDYPKKIKMEKLAKMMKISYSTYQAHLKKAESKILPEIYKKL